MTRTPPRPHFNQRPSNQTGQPIPPVLARMALGLGLAVLGGTLAWNTVTVRPTPGLRGNLTPVNVSQDGLAAAAVRLEGDRTDLRLDALAPGSADLLGGTATHRTRNPVSVDTSRAGGTLGATGLKGATMTAAVTLNVQPLQRGVTVTGGPEPLQHRLDLRLSRGLPITLTTRTVSGDQTLDLSALRLRALTTRTTFGKLNITLPARQSGPLSIVSAAGSITVLAPTGAAPEALRVNADGGTLALNLGAARVQTLSVGASGGNVRLTLPQSGRSSVNAGRGNVTVTVRPGTRGSLDIRAGAGRVLLRVPQALSLRVRFTDRDPLVLPLPAPALPEASAQAAELVGETVLPETVLPETPPPFIPPALDVFVDAPATAFALAYTDAASPYDAAPTPTPDTSPTDTSTSDSTSDPRRNP
ncbi:DUF4097 family beta strand repeat-containing protein [Deinococcus puniceus]|uniref:hypothetical protein n=1 Tax=Deinococcus puniceus TaxID=1182568 RepID=UPI000B1250CB|nr:hypothetical protein [Deinococcus puniceus]